MLVTTLTQLAVAEEAIKQSSIICFDIEATGLELDNGDFAVGIAFYCDFNNSSYYIPFAHGQGYFEPKTAVKTEAGKKKIITTNERYAELEVEFNQLSKAEVMPMLRRVMTTNRKYLCHNAQFDLTALLHMGIDLTGATVYDSMLAARTLFTDFSRSFFRMPDTGSNELGGVGLKWLSRLFKLVSKGSGGVGDEQGLTYAIKELKHLLGKGCINLDIKKHLWALAPETVSNYACMDTDLTYKLHEILKKHLSNWKLLETYYALCEHQTRVAWRMNRTGFMIDHKQGEALMNEYYKEREILLEGIDFNINSPKQVADHIIEAGIELTTKTPTGNYKTDKGVLRSLIGVYPHAANILAIRKLDKNVGTYIKKWLKVTTPKTPYHPTFKVLGTVTGRWSGNMLNIPRNTELKYNPKKLLLPIKPDHCIFELDYKQLEMRVGAWVSETIIGHGENMTLTNLILDGVDMHAYTRDNAGVCEILLNGRAVDEYMVSEFGYDTTGKTDDEIYEKFLYEARQISKVPNFAGMYGGGWEALTDILDGISEEQARAIMEGWREAYPTVVNAMGILSREAMRWKGNPSDLIKAPAIPGRVYKPATRPNAMLYQYIQFPELVFPFINKWSYYSETAKQEKSKDAFNRVVQGTAGLLTVESINRVLKAYPDLTVYASIYDSLVGSETRANIKRLDKVASIMIDWDIHPYLECDLEVAPVGEGWGYKRFERTYTPLA